MIRLALSLATSLVISLTLAASAAAGPGAAPHARVLALVVTNNHSPESGRPDLHYADDDGAKYYDLFRMLAPDEDVELLTDFDRDSQALFPEARAKAHSPTVAGVHAAVTRLAVRARAAAAAGEPTTLYFVFAGHGDVDHGRGYLELRDGRITSDDLEAILREIHATRTHVILDSCNSFFVLSPRKPGGRQIAVTEHAAQSLGQRLPGVGVFLSTSAEAEVFEWSELQSGIFSHAVRSGLAGAADANHDGEISYDELRAFVDVETSRVKNPLYRPKVFARAPDGRGATPIFDTTVAHARRLEVAAGPSRLTVRDPDELPWIDANVEPGAPLTLLVPERWSAGATVDQHEADGTIVSRTLPATGEPTQLASLADHAPRIAARGPNELLSTLFAAPFGPRAFAAWQDEVRREPEPVYGVSSEDAERMRLLLAQVAASERGSRHIAGTALLGIGAFAATEPMWGASSSFDDGMYAIGAVAGIGGLLALLHPSAGERLYDDYVARMADPHADQARVVADTERRLDRLADSWQQTRHVMFAGGIIAGVLGATGLLLTERMQATADTRTVDRIGFGGAALMGLVLVVSSVQASPVEQMRDLWVHDPDLSRMPRFDVTVAPARGGAYLGVTGAF